MTLEHSLTSQASSPSAIAQGSAADLVLRKIRDIPALPNVVNRIVEILGKPSTPASEIADLITLDPGLTSRVLRMVNSAAYGFPRQISSIQHAIMLLGFNTVRGLVLSASILKLFNPGEQGSGASAANRLDHMSLWEHSLSTAAIAKNLSVAVGHTAVGDDAFSAGMLHDIGKIILDTYFRAEYGTVLQTARANRIAPHGEIFCALEQKLMGFNHTDIGAHVAEKWRLPTSLIEVIRFHHQPHEASETFQPLVYAIALANRFCVIHHSGQLVTAAPLYPQALVEYFDLTEEKLRAASDAIQNDLTGASDMLSSLTSSSSPSQPS